MTTEVENQQAGKDGPRPVERDTDTRARAFLQLRATGQQEGFDVRPEEASGNRSPEDRLQRPAVPLSH